jgi:hypothetical protein
VLLEVSIEKEKPIVNKITPLVKKPLTTKRKACCYARRKSSFHQKEFQVDEVIGGM